MAMHNNGSLSDIGLKLESECMAMERSDSYKFQCSWQCLGTASEVALNPCNYAVQ